MAQLYVVNRFQYKGQIVRSGENPEDAVLSVSTEELEEEKKKGKHPKTKRWLSPLFNHCLPADADAHKVFGTTEPHVEVKEDSAEEVDAIHAEFDAIGKAYDRRWGLDRLKTELTKAKRETGA